ncbi:MAG TPA: membrane protein insertion efficiency factor YidD [Polyangiaceae bacterium]
MTPSFAARVLLALVRGYQLFLSPFLGGRCRFEPSCSRYAMACLRDHGAVHGSLLSIVRLCKCHPFHPGGFDPPPAPRALLPDAPRPSDGSSLRNSLPSSAVSSPASPASTSTVTPKPLPLSQPDEPDLRASAR